jgi:hypothetical protein
MKTFRFPQITSVRPSLSLTSNGLRRYKSARSTRRLGMVTESEDARRDVRRLGPSLRARYMKRAETLIAANRDFRASYPDGRAFRRNIERARRAWNATIPEFALGRQEWFPESQKSPTRPVSASFNWDASLSGVWSADAWQQSTGSRGTLPVCVHDSWSQYRSAGLSHLGPKQPGRRALRRWRH